MTNRAEIVIIGGGGHIGLPLAVTLARTQRVFVCETDAERLATLRRGEYPFRERGGQESLIAVRDRLTLTDNLAECVNCRTVILATYDVTAQFLDEALEQLPQIELIVVRSTVAPGTTRVLIAASAEVLGRSVRVAFCPERSAEGESLEEMQSLPQIVGCDTDAEFADARRLFSHAPSFVRLTPEEAEATKLMTNAYRFAHFALANQFYLTLLDHGMDPHRVFSAAKLDYPRMSGFPRAGFVGGPCLRKDSLLFMKGFDANEALLAAALRTNDGMACALIDRVKEQVHLNRATVGLLGYAFKPGSDDSRWSPAKELLDLLAGEAEIVLCTDPHVSGPGLVSLTEVIERSDVLIVVTPHAAYRGTVLPPGKIVIDPWGILGADARNGDAKADSARNRGVDSIFGLIDQV